MAEEKVPQVGAGDVTIWLGGVERVLVPTADAFFQISRQFGGLGVAFDRVMQLDAEAIASVLVAGLRLDGKDAQALPEKIYQTGLGPEGDQRENIDIAKDGHLGLQSRCIRYLEVLRCGGRHPSQIEKKGGGENPL